MLFFLYVLKYEKLFLLFISLRYNVLCNTSSLTDKEMCLWWGARTSGGDFGVTPLKVLYVSDIFLSVISLLN